MGRSGRLAALERDVRETAEQRHVYILGAGHVGRALADQLQHARVTNQFERLVLVAPPRFLGLLRSSIDSPTTRLIVGSIDKDLATSTEAELAKHLREMIAV